MKEGKTSLGDNRLRKKNVNRIKAVLIFTVFLINLACIILSVILFIRVDRLQAQLDVLTENIILTIDDSRKNAVVGTSSKGSIFDPGTAAEDAVYDEQYDSDERISALLMEKVRAHLDPKDNVFEEGDKRRVYLTFDDGPSSSTEKILDILDRYDVKATFFVNGRDTDSMRPLYSEMASRGHTIGMHSYTHVYDEVYESAESFAEDFQRIYDLVYDTTGEEPWLYRFPGGSSNSVSQTDIDELIRFLGAKGIVYYDWNVMSGDATTAYYTADDLVKNVLRAVPKYKYSVVLMHDSSEGSRTVKALPRILDGLKELDCEILPITSDTPVIHHV